MATTRSAPRWPRGFLLCSTAAALAFLALPTVRSLGPYSDSFGTLFGGNFSSQGTGFVLLPVLAVIFAFAFASMLREVTLLRIMTGLVAIAGGSACLFLALGVRRSANMIGVLQGPGFASAYGIDLLIGALALVCASGVLVLLPLKRRHANVPNSWSGEF